MLGSGIGCFGEMQAFIEEEALDLMRRASEGSASETEMGQLRDLLGSSPSLAQTLQTTAQIRVAEQLKSKASVDTSLQISKYYLDFGTKDKKCALNSTVTDKIRIVNTGNTTVKIKFPESQSKPHLYKLTVSPHEFKLKKGTSVDITVEISVSCTTRLKEIITMLVPDSGICHFFSIRVDSVMSQLLDYSELNIGKMVGSGGFGTVHKATWRGLPVAVKKITVEGEEFYQEFQAHREIAHHPNVVHFVGICVSPQAIVCEFIEGGSLDTYLHGSKASTKLGKRIRLKIAHEIAKGMMFLHENDMLHLDLKPQNFLVVSLSYAAPISIKLADFGVSQGSSQTFRGRKVEGSFLYMAPEVLLHTQFSRAADVWSYGACLIEILTDQKPYHEYETLSYLELVQRRNDLELPAIPEASCDPELAVLISSCLRIDRTKRPTFEQIVKVLDQYIERHEDLLAECPASPEITIRRAPSSLSLLSQDILGTTPIQPSPPFSRSPISPRTSPPSSTPSSPLSTPPRSPRGPSSSVPVPVYVPSRPVANAQVRGSSSLSPSLSLSLSPSSPRTPPVPPPRNFYSSSPRSIVIPNRSSTNPPSYNSPSYSSNNNTPASPSSLKHSSFVASTPTQQRPTSPNNILAYARTNSQSLLSPSSPSRPSSPSSPRSPPPAVPPRTPRKANSATNDFDDAKKVNPIHRANPLQRTITDPHIFRMSDDYTEEATQDTSTSQPTTPCSNQETPSSPSFIISNSIPSNSDSLDDPKIESLRHLTHSNFMTAVSALEEVFRSLEKVCSLKLAIELSKLILSYKRSLESACETFLSMQWEGVKQLLLDMPRPNADDFEYIPPSPSLFSSTESHSHATALLSKTAIVLSQALDIIHYFSLRLSSPQNVTEVLTLAKCARWIKNNARLTNVSACASIVSLSEESNNSLFDSKSFLKSDSSHSSLVPASGPA